MYLISIIFDEKKIPDNYFNDNCIRNQKCNEYNIDGDFLIITDTQGILHYYRKDYIVSFHIEYLCSFKRGGI